MAGRIPLDYYTFLKIKFPPAFIKWLLSVPHVKARGFGKSNFLASQLMLIQMQFFVKIQTIHHSGVCEIKYSFFLHIYFRMYYT